MNDDQENTDGRQDQIDDLSKPVAAIRKPWVTPVLQKAEIRVVTEGASGDKGDGDAGITKRI